MTHAEVKLWGSTVAAVTLGDGQEVADFQFAPTFLESGIEPAPLAMPLSSRVYRFPALARESFYGLPGMLADALPDRFGHAVIDAWLAKQGRPPDSLNAVERLCYTGSRGMGAMEFSPATGPRAGRGQRLQVDRLATLASEILQRREALRLSFDGPSDEAPLQDILRVGTSAGGARAKAVIAWNPRTQEVRSGQIAVGDGFEYWLIKFDGVGGEQDGGWAAPEGYGAIEYAYYLMARDAGIEMADSRLFEEGGRRHFMTRRFDRLFDGAKLHMQSLGAMAHLDFNEAGAYSYEQAFMVIRRLGLSMNAVEEQFRRMVFNVFARNQDDHVKNIAFLMDRTGAWSLAPAFDLTYACNPEGKWTAVHQMTLNGKQEKFAMEDFQACARVAAMKRGRAEDICAEVCEVVSRWPDYADAARVAAVQRDAIRARIEEAIIL